MDAAKTVDLQTAVAWDYDAEADVLYLSFGGPRPAVDVDIGDGLVARYDEARDELVGLIVTGLRERLRAGLNEGDRSDDVMPAPRRGQTAPIVVGAKDQRPRRVRTPQSTPQARRRARRERVNFIRRHSIPGVLFLTREEGKQLFDFQARKLLNISGDEFLRRWDAGEYGIVPDTPEGRKVGRLVMLIPFAR